jgi:MATE family multidrug resistance protein
MLFTCPFQVFAGIMSAIQGIFRGSGMQDLGARLNFVAFLVLAVPIGLTLAYQFHMGLIGLWLGLCCGFVCSALYGLYWLSTANWHELALEAQKRTRDPSEISPQTTSVC